MIQDYLNYKTIRKVFKPTRDTEGVGARVQRIIGAEGLTK